jgi:hypothetical protein
MVLLVGCSAFVGGLDTRLFVTVYVGTRKLAETGEQV